MAKYMSLSAFALSNVHSIGVMRRAAVATMSNVDKIPTFFNFLISKCTPPHSPSREAINDFEKMIV